MIRCPVDDQHGVVVRIRDEDPIRVRVRGVAGWGVSDVDRDRNNPSGAAEDEQQTYQPGVSILADRGEIGNRRRGTGWQYLDVSRYPPQNTQ